MGVVIGVIVVAAIIFAVVRALSGPRQPVMYGQPQPGPYVQTIVEPVYIDPINPVAEIGTIVAAEVIGDVVENAIFDGGGGGGYDPGFDPGFGSSGGNDSF